jgi:predicted RNase H-like HicB family nuclease
MFSEYAVWQDGKWFLGYLNKYPDHQTQGHSREELIENLKDLLVDIESGEILYIKKSA